MKLLKLSFVLFLLLTVTSCITTLPLNQQFYNSKKVGIILQIDSIGMAKAGGQGLLDMALTSGNKFREPLKKVEPQLNINEALKTEIINIFQSKNKQYEFITQNVNVEKLDKFQKKKF